jgi:hypothetical protein
MGYAERTEAAGLAKTTAGVSKETTIEELQTADRSDRVLTTDVALGLIKARGSPSPDPL